MTQSEFIIITPLILLIVSAVFVFLLSLKSLVKGKQSKFEIVTALIQIASIIVWIAILGGVFFKTSDSSALVDTTLYITSVVIAIFLIRLILKQIKQHEELQILIKRVANAKKEIATLEYQRTEFISIASHQLRSPLTAIHGYSSMILEGDYGKFPEELREPLTRIHSSSSSLGFLISDFLNISRIEKGGLVYTYEKIELISLLNDLVREFGLVAKDHNLILRKKFDEDKTVEVKTDRNKLKQVISNIIDNAIKYTIKGSVEIDIFTKANFAIVTIKDTGIGISREDKSKLFQKFSRGTVANTVNVYGSGLGLYVAKVMIEAQGGRIWLESDGKNHGSTFYIQIPLHH